MFTRRFGRYRGTSLPHFQLTMLPKKISAWNVTYNIPICRIHHGNGRPPQGKHQTNLSQSYRCWQRLGIFILELTVGQGLISRRMRYFSESTSIEETKHSFAPSAVTPAQSFRGLSGCNTIPNRRKCLEIRRISGGGKLTSCPASEIEQDGAGRTKRGYTWQDSSWKPL